MLVAELRKLAWAGTPSDLRPVVWPTLLVSHLPLSSSADDLERHLSPRVTFLCLQIYVRLLLLENEKSISRWQNLRFPETDRVWTNKSGIRLRSTSHGRDQEYYCGCRRPHNV